MYLVGLNLRCKLVMQSPRGQKTDLSKRCRLGGSGEHQSSEGCAEVRGPALPSLHLEKLSACTWNSPF